MLFVKILFWLSLFVVFYSYIGYGILLMLLLKIKKISGRKNPERIWATQFEPPVTMVIATYNEELVIRSKIENTLSLDYPTSKLKIIVIADGSTDDTVKIAAEFPGIRLLYEPERRGKIAAINRAMKYVDSEFVIFCDANTTLNHTCVREIVKHYQDPVIGAVAGEKKVISREDGESTAGAGEGLYWKYESFLKQLDSDFYTVVGAAGELFSIRTALYEHTGSNILLDDFMMSMKICKKGYRVVYEPKAFASEASSLTMEDEQKRKVRISAGGFQSVFLLKELLNVFRFPKLSFQYISHRVLRWVVCPLLLPIALICNIILGINGGGLVYQLALIAQIMFYLAALTGWIMAMNNTRSRFFYVPYYFVFMNVSLYMGFLRYLNNTQSVLWEKAARKI